LDPTARPRKDFGVDLELELTKPVVLGEVLKVQVKTTETLDRRAAEIEGASPRSLIHLGENLRCPMRGDSV
jgi:hypothetical protein